MDVCASLSQDGFQREGVWEVGRTYCGPASAPSFRLSPRLRTSPSCAPGEAMPLTASVRKLRLLCLSPNQGRASAGILSHQETGGSCSGPGPVSPASLPLALLRQPSFLHAILGDVSKEQFCWHRSLAPRPSTARRCLWDPGWACPAFQDISPPMPHGTKFNSSFLTGLPLTPT